MNMKLRKQQRLLWLDIKSLGSAVAFSLMRLIDWEKIQGENWYNIVDKNCIPEFFKKENFFENENERVLPPEAVPVRKET